VKGDVNAETTRERTLIKAQIVGRANKEGKGGGGWGVQSFSGGTEYQGNPWEERSLDNWGGAE